MGNLTQSLYIAFHVNYSGDAVDIGPITTVITAWNVVRHNEGSCYSNGVFTPTIKGYYCISVALGTNNGRGFSIRKNATSSTNGIQYAGGYNSTDARNMASLTAVVYMNGTTDTIGIYTDSDETTWTSFTAQINKNSYFNGHLLMSM